MSLPSKLASLGLRRWPEEAFEYEPAHGFFVRLAQRNGAHSTRVFAELLGLNGRDFDLEDMLSFCRAFPARQIDRLAAATPTFEGTFVYLNGQKFRKLTDWSLAHPRVCGECLAESRHHRNWWDLCVIERCPIHDRPLQRGIESEKLAWWHPAIGVTPCGTDLSIRQHGESDVPRASWDAYVLGRMGVIPRFSVPSLDDCEMFDVIAAIELLGRAAVFGFATTARRRFRGIEEQRHVALKIGFAAFRNGTGGLEALIREYLASSNRSNKPEVNSPIRYFGWLYNAAKCLPRSPAKTEIAKAISNIAFSAGLTTRGRPRQQCRPETLKSAARRLGVSPRRLRSIARKCGLIGRCDAGEYHALSDAALETLRAIVDDLIGVKEALRLTGFSNRRFKNFCNLTAVVPFLNEGTGNVKYRRSEVLAQIGARSDASTTSHAFKARLRAEREVLLACEAGAVLGVYSDDVRKLVEANYLAALPSDFRKGSDLVDSASVESFHSRYIRTSMYATALTCAPGNALKHLRALGVERVPIPGLTRTSFVERAKVRDVLGVSADPDSEPEFPVLSFWTKMRRYLQIRGSGTLIYPRQDRHSATLRTGKLRLSCVASLREADQRIIFECRSRFDPRRTETLVAKLNMVRQNWPSATCIENDNVWVLRDCRHGFSISAQEQWDGHFDWLEERMMLLRPFYDRGRHLASSTTGEPGDSTRRKPASCEAGNVGASSEERCDKRAHTNVLSIAPA
jgi:hypothetical protein